MQPVGHEFLDHLGLRRNEATAAIHKSRAGRGRAAARQSPDGRGDQAIDLVDRGHERLVRLAVRVAARRAKAREGVRAIAPRQQSVHQNAAAGPVEYGVRHGQHATRHILGRMASPEVVGANQQHHEQPRIGRHRPTEFSV